MKTLKLKLATYTLALATVSILGAGCNSFTKTQKGAAIGAGAGLVSDKVSLGFVAATEDQVCQHLQKHLADLPAQDEKSRAVVTQMLRDELRHADMALSAGGYNFPAPVKGLMTLISKAMTTTSYRI